MIINFDFEKSGTAIITFVDQLQSNISYPDFFWELEDLVEKIEFDKKIKSVIFTSQFPDFFPVGFVHSNTEFVLENSITQLISKIRQPVIMSVEKNAKDYGFESMISADLVVCTTGSIFSYRQLIEGIPPLGGVTQRLPRLIGVGRSLDMILTGREISYDEALDINLVQYISETTAIDESLKISQSINQMAPIALLYIKEAVKTGKEMTLTQGISLEADLSFLLQSTHDRKEGLDSFFDRRKPEFKGE